MVTSDDRQMNLMTQEILSTSALRGGSAVFDARVNHGCICPASLEAGSMASLTTVINKAKRVP